MLRHTSIGIVIILAITGLARAEPFGKAADGTAVESFTLKNKNGVTVKFITLGAAITEINVPDKAGKFANVVFGFDDVAGYESDRNAYFGATTGRVCNRIAKGAFTLGGKDYKLAVNNGPNHLHGGVKRSLSKVVWKGEIRDKKLKIIPGGALLEAPEPDVKEFLAFTYSSPDGEEGYPGTVVFHVLYWLTDKNELFCNWQARTNKATPINLTNHSYFNLAGAGSPTVLDHELTIAADQYLPTDATQIPTGKLEPVKGTVFDFNKPTRIGARIEKLLDTPAQGYDHCYVLTKRTKEPTLAAKLRDPSSGRVLTLLTTQPAVQFYTGNHLSGQKGKDGKVYKLRSAACLETSHYPDSVNQPTFPSIILQAGEAYSQTCVYAFSTE